MIDIFISVGRTVTDEQEAFVNAVIAHIRANGLNPRALGRSDWSAEQPLRFIENLMDQCSGTVIIAFERLFISNGAEHRLSKKPFPLTECKVTTVWNQVEAAMAYSRKQPLLVLMEDGLRIEGLLDTGFDWWIQSCLLDSSAMQTAEFLGVFSDWKKRVERYAQGEHRQSAEVKIDFEKLSIGQLIGAATPKQLWTLVLLATAVLGGAFKAGHSWGPIVLGDGKPMAAPASTVDNRGTLDALKTLAERQPPLQGNSTDGNVRPQMDAYITAFEVSDNPALLRAVRELLSEVEARENPAKPKDYFFADNQFRAKLDSFRSQVGIYSQTGTWPP